MNKVNHYGCYSYNDEWYLVELFVYMEPQSIPWDEITAPEAGISPDNWQVPYLEQYLNETGTRRVCDLYDVPSGTTTFSRVAFFLYKTEAKILKTPFGEFPLCAGELPERLRGIIEFTDD